MVSERRTNIPWPSWSKGLLAFLFLIITGIVVSLTITDQSTYVSVEKAVSGDYGDGAKIQVHGTISDLRINDCLLVDGNNSIKVDISSLTLPDTFAVDKGATFTGIIRIVDGEITLEAEKVQMGCPSKYEPAEE